MFEYLKDSKDTIRGILSVCVLASVWCKPAVLGLCIESRSRHTR